MLLVFLEAGVGQGKGIVALREVIQTQALQQSKFELGGSEMLVALEAGDDEGSDFFGGEQRGVDDCRTM